MRADGPRDFARIIPDQHILIGPLVKFNLCSLSLGPKNGALTQIFPPQTTHTPLATQQMESSNKKNVGQRPNFFSGPVFLGQYNSLWTDGIHYPIFSKVILPLTGDI